MDEIFKRIKICDGDRRIGYASVRYPVTENKRINKYYGKLADVFVGYAGSKKLCGALNCRITYEDDINLSVRTEARLYSGCDCVSRHRSSFVWDKKQGTLRYIRKKGIRRSNISVNGTELSIFN